MAATTLHSLLETLQSSLSSAASALPDDPSVLSISSGISLFDTKNELFLSYLHNLVFLILFKIREQKSPSDQVSEEAQQQCWDDIVKNLIGLRLYSDKGVKPLESKLRYEIDRVIQAAEDVARLQNAPAGKKNKKVKSADDGSTDGSEEDADSQDGEDEETSDGEENGVSVAPAAQSRANLANLALPASFTAAQKANRESSSGAYRPPRIAPTAMPTTSFEERKSRAHPAKSRAVDDYIDEEISGAPMAMPSIGSNIVRSGQRTQTAKERREDAERRDYEERNYTRLAPLSKKEMRQREAGARRRNYGGEEWTDLGAGAERVMKSMDDGRRRTSKLEQSRKRHREEPPDAGPNGMSSFEKRRKKTLQRQRR